MKKFRKNTISFVIFVIISAILFQTILSLRIKGKSLNEIDNLEQTSNIDVDLVFLGSSRCWVHFDPAFFDETFKIKSVNIGVDGHTELSISILRLKDYLSRNTPPKFVILSFDPFITAGSYSDNNNFIHKDFFARYSFLPNTKNLLFVNYFKFNSFEKYIPLYAIFKYKLLDDCFNIKSAKKFKRDINHLVDKKWDTIHNPITKELKNNYFTERQIFSIKNSLEELKIICSENSIKLLCIQTPVYKIIHDDKAFRRTKAICKDLNIPFVDINIKPLRDNIKYFYSPSHLNRYGVEHMNFFLRREKTLASFLNKKNITN